MQRLPSARQRYAAAIRATRSQLAFHKDRERFRKRMDRLPNHLKPAYIDTLREKVAKREIRTGKLYLHRYGYLPEKDRKKIDMEVKEVENAKLENLALQYEFRVGKRVCVGSAGSTKGVRGLQGRIGTIREVKARERVCIVEGLEKGEHHTIPFERLRPVQTIYNAETKQNEEVVIVQDNLEKAFKQRRIQEKRDHYKSVQKRRREEGHPRKPGPETYDVDTLENEVNERTWTPELLRVPMPAPIIDELRGKYSRYRKRWPGENGISVRNPREDRKKKEGKEAYKPGGVLAELSLKEHREREKQEGPVRTMPSQKVLEFIGRKMVEKGVPLLSAKANGKVQVGPKTLAIEAKERDAKIQEERRRKREESRQYWPVKGWKEKQRSAARLAEEDKRIKVTRKEIDRAFLGMTASRAEATAAP